MARPAKNYGPLKLRPGEELIIALDDLDFSWFHAEIERVKKMWNNDLHIGDIAKELERDQDEVACLIMHLSRQGKIQKRENGIFGSG
jgi:hypothetical protein